MSSYEETRKKGVAAFMQATGRDEYGELLRRERAALLGPDGRPRPEMVEEVACLACGRGDGKRVFDKDGFTYLRCRGCRSLYVSPQLTEAELFRYYSTSAALARWNQVLLTEAQMDYDRRKFARLLDAALAALPPVDGAVAPKRRVLDVGASVGTFLGLVRDRGHEPIGVEPSDDARARARADLDLDIRYRTLDEMTDVADGSVDVVSYFEVIEHLKRPSDALATSRRLLRPGGVLLALVGGNADSIAMRILRERSLAFDMARLVYFSPASFGELLGRHGFAVERVDSIIPEVDVALNYLRWDDPYRPELDDGDVLPDWFKQSLERVVAERCAGYKFWVIARKTGDAT